MITQPDFEELLRLLEQNNVRYMIVGGYAVAFHGFPRFTKDIDIYFLNSEDNIAKVQKSLMQFGFKKKEAPLNLFKKKGNIIQFGVVPVRIDLINSISGIRFEEAEKHVKRGLFGKVKVNFIGKMDLIQNKRATGRPQDAVDVQTLAKKKNR
jgi:hypothetical protein